MYFFDYFRQGIDEDLQLSLGRYDLSDAQFDILLFPPSGEYLELRGGDQLP